MIYLPASPTVAPLFKDIGKGDEKMVPIENYLSIANLAGLPSLTLPLGKKDGLPFGGNITGRAFEETTVFNVSLAIQNITGLKNLSVKEK